MSFVAYYKHVRPKNVYVYVTMYVSVHVKLGVSLGVIPRNTTNPGSLH